MERIIYVDGDLDDEKAVADCKAIAEWAATCPYITRVEEGPGDDPPKGTEDVLVRMYTTDDQIMDMTMKFQQRWDDELHQGHLEWFCDTDLKYL